MASNLVLNLLITATDTASAAFGKLFKFLDTTTSATANAIRGALSGAFGGAVNDAIAFEAALSRVQSKSGATAEEMQKLKQAAMQSGQSALASAQALEILTGAGLSVDQAISALAPTLRVMSTEQVNAEVAARALTNTASIMGLQLTDTARIGDKLSASASATSTSVTMLAEAFKTGGASAVNAGLSFEETVVLLTAFANAGKEGSEAGTILTAMLTDLGKASGPARTELAKLGITSGDVGAMVDGLAKAGARGRTAIQAFSVESGPGLNALLQVGTKGLAEYQVMIDKATGGLKTAADTISGNTLGALNQLQVAWEAIKLALAGPVLEPIAAAAKGLGEQLKAIAESGVLEKIGKSIADAFSEGGTAMVDWVKNLDWEAFSTNAATAVATVKTSVASMISEVRGSVQTVADVATTVFSPILVAIDGYRLAWYTANGEAEKAIRMQERVEAANAAIGRTLNGTSGELAKNTDATASNTAANEKAVVELQNVNTALSDYQDMAAKAAAASAQAQADYEAGRISAAQYGQALLAAGEANKALETATGAQAASTRASGEAATGAAGKTKQMSEELARARQASDGWSSGMALNVVTLNGLRDVADLTNQKLADLQERQRAGEKLDNEVAAAKQVANEAQDRYNKALDENIVQQQRVLAATQKTNELSEKSGALTLNQARYEEDLANAKGDTEAATRAASNATEVEIANLQRSAAGKQAEIEATDAVIAATERKLAADGMLDEADKAQLATMAQTREGLELERQGLEQTAEQTRELADAKREQKKAAEEVAEAEKKAAEAAKEHASQSKKAAGLISDAYNGAIGSMAGLSDAAVAEFKRLRGEIVPVTDDLEALRDKTEKLDAALSRVGVADGMVAYLSGITRTANEVNKAFLGQAQAAENLTDQLNRVGEAGGATGGALEYLIRQAENSGEQFRLLDQARLDNLQAALEKANDELRRMQQETQDAQQRLAEMNAELLEAQGQDQKAALLKQQIDYQQQLAEIERQRKEAELTGNRDLLAVLNEQKQVLDSINAAKTASINADEAAQNSPNRTTTTASSGGSLPVKTYALNLTSGGQSLATTTTADPEAFLTALERSRRTAA